MRSACWRAGALTFVAAFVLALGHPAGAQDAPADTAAEGDAPDAQAPAPPTVREEVVVVGVAPLPGVGVPRSMVPANVQILTADRFDLRATSTPIDVLTGGLGSVGLNEAQVNPFQPDIQFRGFTGSPLLGLPQGLAAYQDGVRMNEPFGDTINWDLLPAGAIATVNVIPGSSPLFGLNALGGAISIQTKTGFSHPGHTAQVAGGSFGRRWLDARSGDHGDQWAYFVAGRALAEDGWRPHSPSRIAQGFAAITWQDGAGSTFASTITAATNRLIGNAGAPVQLLEEDRSALFTYPDETLVRMGAFSTKFTTIAGGAFIEAVAFYRPTRISTFNGDDTTYDECEDPEYEELLCGDEGEGDPVRDQSGALVTVAGGDNFDATNNRTRTHTHGWGGSFQATWTGPVAGRENQFIVGVSLDGASSEYEATTELAHLADDRGTEGTGRFDPAVAVGLGSDVAHVSAHVADFFTVTAPLTLSGALRVTHSAIRLRDRLGDELDGDHAYTRADFSAGATYALAPSLTAHASLSTASRVPTPSELGCADPEAPCRLPNAFLSDPPLDQVVSRSIEAGLRGWASRATWSAVLFRTTLDDDILFISSGALTNAGHFANVGTTARSGLETSLTLEATTRARVNLAYTYLRAQFRTPLTISSPNHPDAVNGEIDVPVGSRLPGLPAHTFRVDADLAFDRLIIAPELIVTSGQYLRADEANLLPPVDGRAVASLNAAYRVGDRWRVTASVSNLFGAEYSTFGTLGDPEEVLGDDYDDPRFLSPGAPRAAWIGLEVALP